jgi:hypothetical protein
MAPAHGQAEYAVEAECDGGKRVMLNCIAGFLDRVGRHVLSAFVLAARHVPYAVAQIFDILSDPLERPTIGHFGWRIFSPARARLHWS